MIKSVDKSEIPEITNRHPKHHFLSGPYLIWKNLTDYFPVLSNFIQRDIQLKYRNSLFGFFWSLLEPLILSGVYFILFIVAVIATLYSAIPALIISYFFLFTG